jgi:hypothetical protein
MRAQQGGCAVSTIVDPDIFDRKLYHASDGVKDALANCGLSEKQYGLFEDVVNALGYFAQAGGDGILFNILAESVFVSSNAKSYPKIEAQHQFGKLRNGFEPLFDETQMIFSSEVIGLANGMIWISLLCTNADAALTQPDWSPSYSLSVITLN